VPLPLPLPVPGLPNRARARARAGEKDSLVLAGRRHGIMLGRRPRPPAAARRPSLGVRMRVVELQKVLRAADPAAVLVSPRILERVIREAYDLPALYWHVPHWKSFVVDRQTLFRHAEQADLELEPDQLLPDTVILLARPPAEELGNLERKAALLKYWRHLFHARVHLALAAPGESGLTPEVVRQRVEEIGRTEFEEVRTVLAQEHYLPEKADDTTTYVEFAAVYLELRYFATGRLPNFFPGIRDFDRVDRLLARDVDSAALFARTRLVDAPDPVVVADTQADESHEAYWRLVRAAERAALSGDTVRAAILRTRAARIAPAALTDPTRAEADADMGRLTARLAVALTLSEAESAQWARCLTLLLDKADQGARPVEALLLSDLQQVCVDHEREIYALDLVEWLLSGGKRPVKRPLPSQRWVRVTKHLRSAAQRLAGVRLSDSDRAHLGRLLQSALHRSEEGLRARFKPVLATALEDVGLEPRNPPERAAFAKMVEELLDRIASHGFLTFADLRDTLSRNQLKLPDLSDPADFIRGDPLLRLDRRLASLLDGVYRPSEFYMRLLERVTALNFGTPLGRLLTRYVTLPLVGAFVILHVVAFLLGMFVNLHRHPWLYHTVLVLQGPLHWPEPPGASAAAGVFGLLASPDPQGPWLAISSLAAQGIPVPPSPPNPAWHFLLLGGLSFFLLGLMQVEPFRRRVWQVVAGFFRGLRAALVDWPLRVVPVGWLRWLITSWPFQLFYWYVVKPAAGYALLWLLWPRLFETWAGKLGAFAAAALVINSRLGRVAGDALAGALYSLGEAIRAGLLPALYRWVVRLFKEVLDALEYVLFTVDEWLRIRQGDSRFSLVLRTVLGALWFPVAYVARFYTVVLIEPGINPIKFPISSLAAKFLYPVLFVGGLSTVLVDAATPFLGAVLASVIITSTLWLLPDAFGFLFWEIKENWSLYRANRPPALRAVIVGSHGETVGALLQPGFHTGTIPRLYARLRDAERQAYKTRDWHAARAYRAQLEEVEGAVRRFVDRGMVGLLRDSTGWRGVTVGIDRVRLAINRIRVELVHGGFPERPVEIEFKHRDGWLLANVADPGWLGRLTPEQLRALSTALAALYKFAGVHLVLEQLRANLPPAFTDFAITPEGLVLNDGPDVPPVTFDLREGIGRRDVVPEEAVRAGPGLDPCRLIFARTRLTWEQLVESWRKDQEGHGHPGLPGLGEDLLPVRAAPEPAPPPARPPEPAPESQDASPLSPLPSAEGAQG
jgi:hypothetical protein